MDRVEMEMPPNYNNLTQQESRDQVELGFYHNLFPPAEKHSQGPSPVYSGEKKSSGEQKKRSNSSPPFVGSGASDEQKGEITEAVQLNMRSRSRST